MEQENSLLGQAYKLAQIFALVGTPVVVAAIGWKAQTSALEGSTSKDYVQLAVQVLRDPFREDKKASRTWAIGIIQKFSPIPFSLEAGRELSQDAIGMLDTHPLLKPAMAKRLPCPLVNFKSLPPPLAVEVARLYAQCHSNQQDLLWLRTYVQLITAEEKDQQIGNERQEGEAHKEATAPR